MKNKPAPMRRLWSRETETRLSSFRDFARFYAGRADLHSFGAALRQLDAYRL
jgi:hypothetical protein